MLTCIWWLEISHFQGCSSSSLETILWWLGIICFWSSLQAYRGISGSSDKPCLGLDGSPSSCKLLVPGPPVGPFFRSKSRRPESAGVGANRVILPGEWGEASPAVGVLQRFWAPPNEFETESLILLELSLENHSNYFLLPFVEYSYNCITVNGVRINT